MCRKAIWCMKFSVDRKYLATGGEDGVINIWKVREVSRRDWLETGRSDLWGCPHSSIRRTYCMKLIRFIIVSPILLTFLGPRVDSCYQLLWTVQSVCGMLATMNVYVYSNTSWIDGLLSCRDMVTSVDFYPEEECYFLTGSMDKKLRMWSIPQGCVLKWVQAPSIITTVTFCPGGLSLINDIT